MPHRFSWAIIAIALCVTFTSALTYTGRRLGWNHVDESAFGSRMVALVPPLQRFWTDPQLQVMLQRMLDKVDNAAVTRLAIIVSVPGPDNTLPLYRYTTLAARAQDWFAVGPGVPVIAAPMSSWASYLEDLNKGQCAYRKIAASNGPSVQHLGELGIVDFDVCPVIVSEHLVGAVFVAWGSERPSINPEKSFPELLTCATAIGRYLTVAMADPRNGI